MKRLLSRMILLLLPAFVGPAAFPTSLQAQEVYTRLTDHKHVQVFNNVSNRLVCQCGCHFLLSQCPHVECPWGIPTRDFIEARILEGMGADQIVISMEKGFGERYEKDSFVRRLREEGREDLAEGYIRGFGRKVRSDTSSGGMAFLVAGFVVLAGLVAWFWLRKNRGGGSSGKILKRGSSESPKPGGEAGSLLDKFKDLDR